MFIYIAAPFFDTEQLDLVIRIEKALELNGFDYFSPRNEGILLHMTPEQKEKRMIDIFHSNIFHMKKADAMIAVIDDWDIGTVFEIGYTYSKRKPIFTFSNNDHGLNVMVRQAVAVHNTNIEELMINLHQFLDDEEFTVNTELSKNVT